MEVQGQNEESGLGINGQWARYYASINLHVIPCWWFDPDTGMCGCGRTDCNYVGKHPITLHGEKDATTDVAQIDAWWTQYPLASIAVCTDPSGLVVLDCDGEDGYTNLLNWCAQFELELDQFPTVMARTGGGGFHLVYAANGNTVTMRNGVLPHVDTKGRNGYIIVSPSLHKSGNRYEWINSPATAAVAPIPQTLADNLRELKGGNFGGGGPGGGGGYDFKDAVANGCKAGHRDHFFNTYAFWLKKNGTKVEEAVRLFDVAWKKCEQPVGEPEFEWDTALWKLKRVYEDDSIQPDAPGVVDWPAGRSGAPSAETGAAGEIGRGIAGSDPLTDIGNAHRLVDKMAGNWKWTPELGWLHYVEGVWLRDSLNEVYELSKGVVADMQRRAAQ